MSKNIRITTLCMLAFLLLSTLSFAIARPMPAFKDVTPAKTHLAEEEVAKENTVESCSGPDEEECLMRRMDDAHLDYIYTKKHQP
ncbi:hypothetical protein R6Q59_012765 [Mikania micrantha]